MQSEEVNLEEEALKELGEVEEMTQEEKDADTKKISAISDKFREKNDVPRTVSNPDGKRKQVVDLQPAANIENADPLEVKKVQKKMKEVKKEKPKQVEFVNGSKNPLVKMMCSDSYTHLQYAKHDFEAMVYTYMSRYLGVNVWAVKCSVVTVDELEDTGELPLYSDYVKECHIIADSNPEHEVFAVKLGFVLD